MVSPAVAVVLVLAALQLGPASAGLFTKRFRLRRAAGANATFFSHVYNIRMPRCESCAADVAAPTATLQEARGETTQQQLYEHTMEGDQQMVFTHRINIPPQACGCSNADTMQRLLRRLEALEAQVAAFRDQCPGGTCCAATQAGHGQTDIQGLCSQHGKFDFDKCRCVCERGWGGPTCSESSCPDSCNDRGTCMDSECICHEGFTGESCELTICLDDCNDQGRCIGGKCVCFPGYTGPACGDQSCPDNCRGHGKCIKDSCVCDPGYTGPDCSTKVCPDNCRDRGKCLNGSCVCESGFGGPDCGTKTCPENCRNRGKCIDGICVCSPGYTGPDCGSRSCPENCKNRGQCINGKCICNPGFTGPACGARSCPENCHGHGQCINGKCLCNPGYSGSSCSSRICPDNCSRRGICKDGRCICSKGFTGPNCGIRTCPENCQNGGRCENGLCVCEAGYAGPNCATKTCPDNCKNRGRCEDGRCVCDEGYAGSNCGTKTCPDNCRNQGRCEDGTCVCETGFTGPNCGTKTCPDDCRKQGRCEDGTCVCETGFTGPNCGTKTCPDDCRNQGRCEDGTCVCETGFTGPNCGTKTCPDNCNNRGQCKDGRCACDKGFAGSNCGTKTCPDDCTNQGRCEDGTCVCETGFTGPNCGTKTCPDNCRNHGRCEDGTCVCETGFTGPNCGTKTCPDNCKNQGRCDDGTCVCETGFTGPNCGTKTCPDNCSSHGLCVDGQCVCKAGYGGPDCGTRTCPNNCNNRGRCENGKCICDKGYGGPICGLKLCPNNCNNQGRCLKGTCICRRGYTGPDCREVTCPSQCQGRGICVDGHCQCQTGYAGPDCGEKTCPSDCSEKGRCEGGKCVCQDGFTGEDCSIEVPAVSGLRMRIRDETSVIMEWERPPIPVDGFEISFRPTNKDDGVLSSRLRSTVTAFNQSGLVPGEEYLVTIWTQKDQTLGPETTKTVTTRIDGPKNLRVTEVTQASITLHWDRPVASVDHYLVTYASEAGVTRQVTVPAAGKEVVTLLELDSGAEYTLTVTAERGRESSMPASTTATTAAADGAGGPGREPLVVGSAEERTTGYSRVVKKPPPSSPTPKVKVTDQVGGQSPEQRPQLTDGERIVTTVITGEERQKVVLLGRRPYNSEEEFGVTKVITEGEPQKVELPKTHSSKLKEERVMTGVITTQEPPKSSGPNVRPVIIKKGRVVTTVITRGNKNVVPTNEKPLVTKDEKEDTTPQTKVQLPHVATSSGRPSVLREERVVKKVLTEEGTTPVVLTGRRPTVTKEKKVVTTAITRKGFKKDGSVDDRSILTKGETVATIGFTEEVSPNVMSTKSPSVTREESVITPVVTREGAKKKLPTHDRTPLTKDGKLVTAVSARDQLRKAMWPTKSPPPLTKKEKIVTSVTAREGTKKIKFTDAISQVTKDTTGKDASPTKKPLIELSSITPGEESVEIVSFDRKIPNSKKVRLIAINVTKIGPQIDLFPTMEPSTPKKKKVVLATATKEQAKKRASSETKPLIAEERELAKVVSGKQLPKVGPQDKRPSLITKDKVREILITGEHSQEVMLPEKRPTPVREEKATISTLAKKEHMPDPGKKPATKDNTEIKGAKKAEDTHKVGSPAKKTGVLKETLVTSTVIKQGTRKESSSDSKLTPTVRSLMPTAVAKVVGKKVPTAEKKPPFKKDGSTITKAVEKEKHQKVEPNGKKPSSVSEEVTVGRPTRLDKKGPGIGNATASKIRMEFSNQTILVDSQKKFLQTKDLMLETVIQNISAKLSPFNGTLLQRLESYLRATSYPLRKNQTIKAVAKAIFLYLINKKPHSVREIVYDRLAEKTPTGVTTPLARPTLSSGRVKALGTTVTPLEMLDEDSDSDGKPKGTRRTGQQKHTKDGPPTMETRKEANTASNRLLKPTSVSQEERYSSRDSLHVAQTALNRTTMDYKKHVRPQVVNRTSTTLAVSLDGLKGHSNSVVIYYKDIRADSTGHRLVFPGDANVAKISGLSPGTTYRIDLHGVFKGQSSKSYSIVTSTAPEPSSMSTASDESPVGAPSTQASHSDSMAGQLPASAEPYFISFGELSVTNITYHSFALSWNADPGAYDHFAIRYKDSAATGPVEVLFSGDQRTATLSPLLPGTEYEIELQGVVDGLRTIPLTTKATTDYRKPKEQPSLLGGLAITSIAEDGFSLTWKARKGVFDVFLVRYEDARGQFGSQEITVPGDHRVTTIRGLDSATEYIVSLYGVRRGQLSRALKTKVTTASAEGDGMPARVEDLSATDIQEDSIRLSWTVHDGDFDFFLIQYRDADGQTQEMTIRGDQTSANIPGLLHTRNYTFVLYGISDDEKTKPISVTAMTAPLTPRLGDLSVLDVTQDSLRLSWSVQDGEFDSFLLQYRDSQGRTEQMHVDAGLHKVTVSGLQPAETYMFELVGLSTDKQSEPVSVVAKTALPEKTATQLFNLSATDVTQDSLHLYWNASAEDFDSFLIQYRDAEGKPQELIVDGDLRSATISGLRPSKKYKFSLYGVSGDRREKSISTEVTTAAAGKAQITPRLGKLNISDIMQDSLRLSWTVQGGDFDSFLILYRDAQGNIIELPVPGDLQIVTISGLKPSKKYKFLLHGISASKRSKPVSAEATTAAAGKVLISPRLGKLNISDITQDSLRLSWTVQGGDFDSFLILYRDPQGNALELPVPGDLRIETISGLKPSKKYKFLLHGISTSKRSKPVSAEATTAAAGKVLISPRLGKLNISDITQDSLRLSWTLQGGDFDSFLILYRDAQGNTLELPVPGDLRTATISGLKPSKKYKFLLHGISTSKRSKPVSAEATTAVQKKKVAMMGDISITEVQKDSLVLSWAVSGGDFDSFVIQYKDSEGIPRQTEVDGHLRTTTIKGLKPSGKYKFVLYGVSENRRAPPVSAEAITAAFEDPPTPSPWLGELTVSDVTKDSVLLSWTHQGGDYDTFLILYRDADGRPRGLPVQKEQRTAHVSGLMPATKYTFLLYGVKGRSRSTPITAEATTGPDKVQAPKPMLADLSISEVTEDSLQLSWAVQGGDFDTFLIQYRDPEETPQELEVDGKQHTATISGLVPSEKYTFYLQGIIGTQRIGPISTEAVTASLEKPKARPARLGDLSISNITQGSLQLSWTIQDGDFDSFLIQYRDIEGKVQELPVDRELHTVTVSGLRPSKKYKFILYGLTGDRRSKSISTEATTVPLEKVTTRLPRLSDLSVSDITKDSLQLSWAVEDGSFGSFLIQYRDADGTPTVLIVDGDFRTARIVGLKPAKKYKFNIYGVSGERRTKALATEATTAPPEKANTHPPRLGEFFVSDITKDSLQLTWTVEDGDFDSFVIQYRDTDGQTQELVVEGDLHTTTVTGLLPSRKYEFNLYGISRNRRTKPISTEATTAFPEAVGQQAAMLDDLYLSDMGPHTVHLSWDASEGAFDSFLIQYADSKGVSPKGEMVMAGNARTAMIEGLEPNTEYTFTLSGLHRGQKRANLSTVGRTTRLDLESPRNLEFRNIKETSFMVIWTRPTMPIDTFKVSYQLADGGEPQSLSVDGKATKVPLKGLTPGARYEVNVMSIRGFEESEPLTGYVTTVPDGPTDLRAINITETSALLLWRPALAYVDTYVVTFSAHNVPEVTKLLSGNTAELQLRGLNINTEYTATIHSTKGSNRSSPAITTFTTSADAPRDLVASRVTPRSAVLSWTPAQAVPTGYVLTYETASGETKEIQLEASATSYTLSELIPSSQYRARVQAMRDKVKTAPTSTTFTTARLRYPFPRDCAEERLNGAIRSQPVTIYLKGDRSHPLRVFCDMDTDGGGWMVVQRRMNGKTNFWRNWYDYAAGFGNLTQEFWLGNENLHKLTSQGAYELRVDLRTKNESAYAVYESFRVDTQDNYYRLRLGKYSGTAGDSLSYHNNMIFSTRDRDRNKHIMPCSISYRGAWWYKNCHYANLNGLYGNNKDHQGINWYTWKGFEFSIPFTEMKMRPKNSVALRRI
ncbi:tenascin-X isoform X3 [Pleurodeles waltl]|uniref:tenascin-X isoform X3 n=1 Tax=Pleurodeles waltl TaxID=8319 RepID=UPI003709854B